MKSKETRVVMRHGNVLPNGQMTEESVHALFFAAGLLSFVANERKIVVYHSETDRARVTAEMLYEKLVDQNAVAEVGGELDELHSADPLLRKAINRPVEDGTFAVYISHEPIIKMTLTFPHVRHCEVFGENCFPK